MKKISIMLLLLLAGSALSFAASVPVNTAKTVGYHYLIQHTRASLKSADDLQLLYTSGNAPAFFYVFGNGNCFVMVSADDAITPVLGYSDQNSFRSDNMPTNVSGFFDNYSQQIAYAIKNHATAPSATSSAWSALLKNNVTTAAKTTAAVLPLLGSLVWDQAPYYNALCPADAAAASLGGHDPTGCVATAMAQVMKYWNWPTTGTGSHSYNASPYGTKSANFGTTTYRWSAMPNSLGANNGAIDTLMYHCGIAINMHYTASESGAYVTIISSPITNCAEYALKTYFGYKSTMSGKARDSYSTTDWINMLETDIKAARPVIYDGNGTSGGHCFVFDGYDASDKFHINWGWSGASNGYFTIDALDPPSLGTGGGGGGFNSNEHAIFGLEPNGVVPGSVTPDIYEANNTEPAAYNLPLTWTANVATQKTTGSNFHTINDQDYYKIVLPAGYNYSVTARLNDAVSKDDGITYTVDGQWTYSKNDGATWSSPYNDVMSGTIALGADTGGTIIFHVSPKVAGTMGTYLFKISNITRTGGLSVPEASLPTANIYPNPAYEQVNINLGGTGAKAIKAMLTDMQGKVVYSADVNNQTLIIIPVRSLAPGLYIVNVTTDAGVINEKITVGTK